MKFKIIVLLFVFSVAIGNAQDNFFRVITCKGEVYHIDESDNKSIVVPGSKIEASGKLVLNEGSMIKIISKDRPQKLQSEGTYDLKELYYSGDVNSMSFTGKFWNYLMEGLQKSDSKDDLKKYGNQLAAGGIKGYNKSSNQGIEIVSPIYGKITSTPLQFEWKTEDEYTGKYSLVIYDSQKTEIYKQETSNISAQISHQDLQFSQGTYFWKVTGKDISTQLIPFQFDPLSEDKIAKKLNRISDYVEGDELEKSWITAVVFEMEGYDYNAGLKYKDLVEAYPNHLLFKRLYALHLVKMGRADSTIDY